MELMSNPDILQSVFTVFILEEYEQKKELIKLMSEYLDEMSIYVTSKRGTNSQYSQENGSLMQKIRNFRDQYSLSGPLLQSKKGQGGGQSGGNSGGNSRAFAALTEEEKGVEVQAYLAEQKTRGGNSSSNGGAGTGFASEMIHDGKQFFLVPRTTGLYCSVKDVQNCKGEVSTAQGIYTAKLDRKTKTIRAYIYESAAEQDPNKTGPTANFSCDCGMFYHAQYRCLNRDY